jgi:hypothetical protein
VVALDRGGEDGEVAVADDLPDLPFGFGRTLFPKAPARLG